MLLAFPIQPQAGSQSQIPAAAFTGNDDLVGIDTKISAVVGDPLQTRYAVVQAAFDFSAK